MQLIGNTSRQPKNLLGLVALAGLGVATFNTLLIILLAANVGRMNQKDAPAMVQLNDGLVLTMTAQDAKNRTPQTIMKFTGDALSLLMSWSGKVPSPNAEAAAKGVVVPDPGVEIKGNGSNKKVTSVAHKAGFLLSEDFRPDFIKALAEMTPESIFTGSDQTVLVPIDISYPEKIKDGQWKVRVVANLIRVTPTDPVGMTIPFNKDVFIRSIPVMRPSAIAGEVEKTVAQIRSSGLEIYAMRDLTRPDPTE